MSKLMRRPFGGGGLFPTAFPADISREFENFFDLDKFFRHLDLFDAPSRSLALRGFPRGDIFVEDNNLVLELALAGYSKDQLQVQVSKDDHQVIISAGKKDKDDGEESRPGRSLARRSFKKIVEVLPEWDLEKAEVVYKDGLLRVVVPPVDNNKEDKPEYTTVEIK